MMAVKNRALAKNFAKTSKKTAVSRSTDEPKEQEQAWILRQPLLPALCALLSCLPSIDGNFVFDDAETVVRNPIVNGKVALQEIFWRDFWGTTISSPNSHKSYRPLTTFTFWLNNRLHGSSTIGYHVVNIGLHVSITMLVWKLMKRHNTSYFVQMAATLLFAVHPIHTEAVCNVTGRAELLMALFFLFGINEYLERPNNFYKIALFSFLAFAAKEQGIMLEVLIIFNEVFVSYKANFTQNKTRITFHFVYSGMLLYLRMWINNFQTPKFTQLDNAVAFVENPFFRAASIVFIWFYNIYLLVLPLNQCFDYSMGCLQPILNVNDRRIILLGVAAISTPFIARNFLKFESSLLFRSIIFGMVTFLPASNILLPVGFTVAERVLYLPSIGICCMGAILLEKCQWTTSLKQHLLFPVIGVLLCISWQRSFDWRSERTLYASGLRVCHQNAKIHYNLGKILNEFGETDNAVDSYRNALRLHPQYESAMNNLANIYEQRGQYTDAARLLQEAIIIRPSFATAWMNLGIAEMHLGNFAKSFYCFNTSLHIRPESSECYFNLGNLFRAMNRSHDALSSWKTAVSLDPDNAPAWINLFVHLDEIGKCHRVVQMASKAAAVNNPAINFQIGTCYGQLGEFVQAEKFLLHAIEMRPLALYYANLGVLYQRWRRFSLAEQYYRLALTLDSSSSGVAENLESLLRSKAMNETRSFRGN